MTSSEPRAEPMIRGYSVPNAARAILGNERLRARIVPQQVEELTRIAAMKPERWAPRQDVIRLFEIIEQASPDEATCYENLVRCGEASAQEAISTFLKLLIRMLSPKQFVRKIPDIWTHEHQGGQVEAELEGTHSMLIRIRDVEGFVHAGPISIGFMGVVLRAMGLKDLQMRDLTWSLKNPAPRDVHIRATWR